MSPRIEVATWALTIVLLAVSARVAVLPIPVPENGTMPLPMRQPSARTGQSLRDAAQEVADADPFRLSRQASQVGFAARADVAPKPATVSPEVRRPTLVLRGIAGGPPWEALLDGLPSRDGTVLVRAGDKIGDVRIVGISKDTVIIRGMDTTWRLALGRTWR